MPSKDAVSVEGGAL